MGVRPFALAIAALVLACTACASAPPHPSPPRPGGTGHLEVTVTGLTNEEGQVLVALFLDERGWPGEHDLAFGAVVLPIDGQEAVANFDDVPAGPFAVSVFQDEDLDRELDTGLFGIPTEDYGFSNGAHGTFGPPSFEDAHLEIAAGESKSITVRVE